jgi:hypothetical protein
MLARGGFDVLRVASSAEEALRFLDDVRPDMVLIEVDLKGPMDGIDLAAVIGAATPPTALAFVAGTTDTETLGRVKTLGPHVFLVKPVNQRQLNSAMELALHRFRHETQMVANRNLGESEFRQLFEASLDAIVVVDVNGRIVEANAEMERRFGHRAGAVVGEPIEILVPASLRAAHVKERERFTERPFTRRMGERLNLSARRADGSEFPVDVSLAPVGTGPGMRVIAVIRDASERHALQRLWDERQALAEQVDRALRLEAVGQLAGGVAHDFNNMLTIVTGYTDSLLRDDLDAAARRRLVEGIRATTNRAAALTRQLLAFGRRQVLQPEVVSLAAVVTSMQDILVRLLGERIRLVVASAPDVKAVTVDPTQMEQVILNLVLNARNAMAEGGTLMIEVKNADLVEALSLPLSMGVAPEGAYVMLSVRDDGAGMERAVAQRAFEPFFTTRGPGQGTGLGLSTVYGIVKQSGGYVWIDSTPGGGTSVHLLLPRSDAEVPVQAPAAQTALPYGSGLVLLVEDEPEVRELLAETLSRAGYTVVAAENGRAAIEAFEEARQHVDVIVTDVVMPGTDGPALVRVLRARRPGLKVLYISGYAADEAAAEMGEDAFTRYLQKPFDRDHLLLYVAELLASRPIG